MKQVLSNIENVKKGTALLNYLITRPKSEMVGLGLVYGAPGLGKTRWATRTAFANNFHIYVRIDAAETQRTFLEKLYTALQYTYGIPQKLRGSKQKFYLEIVDILVDAPQTVLFIDEIDYAFRDKKLLGSIRDLADETLATIVLIGMQDAKQSLLKANAHYFDRCNSFCEFRKLSPEDTALVCAEVSDVELEPEVVKYIHGKTKGTIRRIVKMVDFCERAARARKLKKVALKDLGNGEQ